MHAALKAIGHYAQPNRVFHQAALELAQAASLIHMMDAVTPLNWQAELLRLRAAYKAGKRMHTGFLYPAPSALVAPVLYQLEHLAHTWESTEHPGPSLAARAAELLLEGRIALAVGSCDFLPLARLRFASTPAEDARAQEWALLEKAPAETNPERVISDNDRDPRSLFCMMQQEIGKRRLPVRIVVRNALAPLAATGADVVFVAAGRAITIRTAQRTVIHEIEGHVLPGLKRHTRAASLGIAVFRNAGDTDSEEGYAIDCERRAGFLDTTRKKELGLRHRAACLAHEGAPFHDIVNRLEHLGADDPVYLTARALRGGGLGRERLYLPAFWQNFSSEPCDER